jgi:hypothetical protein
MTLLTAVRNFLFPTVHDGPSLLKALSTAKPGDTIQLGSGVYTGPMTGSASLNYPGVTLKGFNFSPPVTIRGTGEVTAGPGGSLVGARVVGLCVKGSTGLTFKGVDFDLPPYDGPADPTGNRAKTLIAAQVTGSGNITFQDCIFRSAPSVTLATAPSALLLSTSAGVVVEGCEFKDLHYAIEYAGVSRLLISNNFIHNCQDDAMRGGGVKGFTVTGNRLQNLHPDASDQDHPDSCQIWTSGGMAPTTDVVISDNFFGRGTGQGAQGFPFCSNTGQPFAYHERFTVQDNIMAGCDWNGTTLAGVDTATITRNILQADSRMILTGVPPTEKVIVPRIILFNCKNVAVTDNVAGTPIKTSEVTGFTESGNTVNEPYTDGGAALLALWLSRKPRRFNSSTF